MAQQNNSTSEQTNNSLNFRSIAEMEKTSKCCNKCMKRKLNEDFYKGRKCCKSCHNANNEIQKHNKIRFNNAWKKCTQCNLSKTVEDFYESRSKCKTCYNKKAVFEPSDEIETVEIVQPIEETDEQKYSSSHIIKSTIDQMKLLYYSPVHKLMFKTKLDLMKDKKYDSVFDEMENIKSYYKQYPYQLNDIELEIFNDKV